MNKIELLIAEPWDFQSEAGLNKLIVEVEKENSERLYCKCASDFENMTEHLLLVKRDDFGNFNIYKCNGDSNNIEELEFSMVGVIQK